MRRADSSGKFGIRYWNNSRKAKDIRVLTKTEVKNTSKRQMTKKKKKKPCHICKVRNIEGILKVENEYKKYFPKHQFLALKGTVK